MIKVPPEGAGRVFGLECQGNIPEMRVLKSQGEEPGRESGRCEGTEPRVRWWPLARIWEVVQKEWARHGGWFRFKMRTVWGRGHVKRPVR